MSYRDPYADQSGRQPQPQYSNDDYNPYGHHQPYDQPPATGYRDEPAYAQSTMGDSTAPHRQLPVQGVARTATIRSFLTNNNAATDPRGAVARKETSGFDEPFTAPRTKELPYVPGGGENMWTRGSKPRVIGRFFCCTFMTAIFLFLSIVLTLVLFIRPPVISISDIDTSAITFDTLSNGIRITGLSINVTVNNPNYFDVNFPKVIADLYIDDIDIGGGNATDVNFPAGGEKSWQFPFEIEYTTDIDSGGKVLQDLIAKCGLTGGEKSNLDINYKIKPTVKVLFVKITPSVSGTFSFVCPLDGDSLSGLAGTIGR